MSSLARSGTVDRGRAQRARYLGEDDPSDVDDDDSSDARVTMGQETPEPPEPLPPMPRAPPSLFCNKIAPTRPMAINRWITRITDSIILPSVAGANVRKLNKTAVLYFKATDGKDLFGHGPGRIARPSPRPSARPRTAGCSAR